MNCMTLLRIRYSEKWNKEHVRILWDIFHSCLGGTSSRHHIWTCWIISFKKNVKNIFHRSINDLHIHPWNNTTLADISIWLSMIVNENHSTLRPYGQNTYPLHEPVLANLLPVDHFRSLKFESRYNNFHWRNTFKMPSVKYLLFLQALMC